MKSTIQAVSQQASTKEGPTPHMSRRTALGLMAGGLAATTVARALPTGSSAKRPNVVFVLMDDVGYGDLACLGNPYIKTPVMDAMHASSTRFTDYHVSPTCSPTRASLMTGRYCNSVGVWHTIDGRNLLDPNAITMAECFKASGYRTANYGKWHLGDNYPCRPIDRGFDDAVICGGGGIWQGPDYFGNHDFDDHYIHNGDFQQYKGFATDVFFDCAMDFMRDAQKHDQPFFCYLATPAAHEPVWSKDSDAAPYQHVPGLPHAGFYGMIANLDENLGRLTRFLEDNHLRENTILIFSSDNGTAEGQDVFNAGMRSFKGSAYDGGHRMPLFIQWPGGNMPVGKDVPQLTAHIDLLPTLIDLCGLESRNGKFDGASLRPLIFGSGTAWPDRTIVTDSQREENLVKWKETAVMTHRWRLVSPTPHGNLAKLELYDIQADPGQQHNIIADHPNVVAKLKVDYEAWWTHTSSNQDYVRIGIGSEAEKLSRLNCMDWHGYGSDNANNQNQIRRGLIGNGFWALNVCRSGRYRFELRRWPRELDLPINAEYQSTKSDREQMPGAGIHAQLATLTIGAQAHAPDGSGYYR
ncbi:MAG: arylsulfatase, partial [Acidobacteriota bacterium]